MNRLPKTVFSTTLSGDPGWNATLVKDDLAGAIARLKAKVLGDLYLFGGAGIANSLVGLDLVDEYRLMVTPGLRSEEHTSELQSLMRISYAVFCLKKKNTKKPANRDENVQQII